MNQTLIGYFDNSADANRARQELLQAGFADSRVTVQAGSTTGATGASTTTSTAVGTTATATGDYGSADYRADRDRDSGIGGFFRSLFGLDDDDEQVSVYSEGVRRGGSLLMIDVDSDEQVQRAEEILQRCGAVDVDERAQQWRSEGWAGSASGAASLAATGAAAERVDVSSGDARTIPVVQEELQIGKREVRRGGLRVFTRIVETPVQETVRLREEQATIERRPVDRPATEADFAAMKEGSIEVRETSEEAVVSKVARVTEEVQIGKNVTEREQVVSDTVRHTDVQVEQLDSTRAAGTTGTLGTTGTAGATSTAGLTGTTGTPRTPTSTAGMEGVTGTADTTRATGTAGATGTTDRPLTGGTSPNESQVEGRGKQAEGAAKDAAGAASGDLSQQAAGKIEKAAGKVQEGYGNLKDDLKRS